MKILVLRGNPRKDGVSEKIADIFTGALRRAGADVADVRLASKKIKPCEGCFCCVASGKCKINDDAAEILEVLDEADALVCVSPVYFYSMSGLLKNFFDRCFPFVEGYYLDRSSASLKNSMRFSVKNKKFLAISVASGRMGSFEALSLTYKVMASAMGFELVADIRRGESPYFSQLSMGSVRIRSILKAFESAAEEFVSTGSVSAETVGIAERPIAESDSAYSKHTAVFWKLKRSGSGAGKSVRKKI